MKLINCYQLIPKEVLKKYEGMMPSVRSPFRDEENPKFSCKLHRVWYWFLNGKYSGFGVMIAQNLANKTMFSINGIYSNDCDMPEDYLRFEFDTLFNLARKTKIDGLRLEGKDLEPLTRFLFIIVSSDVGSQGAGQLPPEFNFAVLQRDARIRFSRENPVSFEEKADIERRVDQILSSSPVVIPSYDDSFSSSDSSSSGSDFGGGDFGGGGSSGDF